MLRATGKLDGNQSLAPRSRYIVPISVGQQYHEGESFEATIDFLNKNAVYAVFVVADSLQAYNLKGADEKLEDARSHAKVLGSEWFRRNSDAVSKLKIHYKIVWWDDELQDEKYDAQLAIVNSMYNTDDKFQRALEKTAGQFHSRRFKKSDSASDESSSQAPDDSFKKEVIEKSKDYLLEECAVLYLWEKYHCNYLVYPRKLTPVLEYIVKNNPSLSLVPMVLKFTTVHSHSNGESSNSNHSSDKPIDLSYVMRHLMHGRSNVYVGSCRQQSSVLILENGDYKIVFDKYLEIQQQILNAEELPLNLKLIFLNAILLGMQSLSEHSSFGKQAAAPDSQDDLIIDAEESNGTPVLSKSS